MKWIIDLNMEGQTVELLKGSIENYIFMTLGRQRASLDKARKGLFKLKKPTN